MTPFVKIGMDNRDPSVGSDLIEAQQMPFPAGTLFKWPCQEYWLYLYRSNPTTMAEDSKWSSEYIRINRARIY